MLYTNININNLFNDKVVYSDINEKVKEANQEKSEKTKVKKEAKKIKPSKDKNGAYNVNGTIIVNKKYGLDENYTEVMLFKIGYMNHIKKKGKM